MKVMHVLEANLNFREFEIDEWEWSEESHVEDPNWLQTHASPTFQILNDIITNSTICVIIRCSPFLINTHLKMSSSLLHS